MVEFAVLWETVNQMIKGGAVLISTGYRKHFSKKDGKRLLCARVITEGVSEEEAFQVRLSAVSECTTAAKKVKHR